MAKRKRKVRAALLLHGERVGLASFKSEAAARAYAKAERMSVKDERRRNRKPKSSKAKNKKRSMPRKTKPKKKSRR